MGLLVRLGCPFRKRCERIVAGFGRLVEQDAVVGYAIAQGIARLKLQSFAHLTRNHGLALDRDLRERGGLARDAVNICKLAYRLTIFKSEGLVQGGEVRLTRFLT